MESEILFSERQRWPIFLYILLGTVTLIFVFGFVKQFVFKEPFGTNPASNVVLLVVSVFVMLITVFVSSMKLETLIKNDGIYVRMFPTHVNYKKYEWKDIYTVSVREYKPIGEYGGWGIKGSGDDRALNMSGNKGIQLVLNNGKKLLIGTQKEEEVNQLLKKFKP
jgi:hypothetical protein